MSRVTACFFLLLGALFGVHELFTFVGSQDPLEPCARAAGIPVVVAAGNVQQGAVLSCRRRTACKNLESGSGGWERFSHTSERVCGLKCGERYVSHPIACVAGRGGRVIGCRFISDENGSNNQVSGIRECFTRKRCSVHAHAVGQLESHGCPCA